MLGSTSRSEPKKRRGRPPGSKNGPKKNGARNKPVKVIISQQSSSGLNPGTCQNNLGYSNTPFLSGHSLSGSASIVVEGNGGNQNGAFTEINSYETEEATQALGSEALNALEYIETFRARTAEEDPHLYNVFTELLERYRLKQINEPRFLDLITPHLSRYPDLLRMLHTTFFCEQQINIPSAPEDLTDLADPNSGNVEYREGMIRQDILINHEQTAATCKLEDSENLKTQQPDMLVEPRSKATDGVETDVLWSCNANHTVNFPVAKSESQSYVSEDVNIDMQTVNSGFEPTVSGMSDQNEVLGVSDTPCVTIPDEASEIKSSIVKDVEALVMIGSTLEEKIRRYVYMHFDDTDWIVNLISALRPLLVETLSFRDHLWMHFRVLFYQPREESMTSTESESENENSDVEKINVANNSVCDSQNESDEIGIEMLTSATYKLRDDASLIALPRCSGRDSFISEVLNDEYYSTSHRKKYTQEVRERDPESPLSIDELEDARFEIDIKLHQVSMSVEILEDINQKMRVMSPEKLKSFRLDEDLGGSSVLHRELLQSLFRDDGGIVLQGLQDYPEHFVPAVLQKVQYWEKEWQRWRGRWNCLISDQENKPKNKSKKRSHK